MTNVVRYFIKLIPAAVAVIIVIVAWQVPPVRLPIASWLLWMALCWRPAPDHRS